MVKSSRLSFCLSSKSTTAVRFFDALSELFDTCFSTLPRAYEHVVVFIDKTVRLLHEQALKKAFEEVGIDPLILEVPEGEAAKSCRVYQQLSDRILDSGVDENTLVINVGGGSVCNIGGFVASTLFRGVDLIHMPTTLLAQSDAAVGNKQAINTEHGKNLLGTYYSPREVWIVFEHLKSLPPREIRSGLAESIKHGLAQDKALLEYLSTQDCSSNHSQNHENLKEAVYRTIAAKIQLMEQDYKEQNVALTLQYGHTIGHAVEFLSGYDLRHGEAISIGMYCAAKIASELQLCSTETLEQHVEILSRYGLPHKLPPGLASRDIADHLRYSRKSRGGNTIGLVLLRAVGELYHDGEDYRYPIEHKDLISLLEVCR